MGTILGYATVTIMTDSGIGLVEESVGVNAGAGNMPVQVQVLTTALQPRSARAFSAPSLPS